MDVRGRNVLLPDVNTWLAGRRYVVFSQNSNTHLPTPKVLGSQPTQPGPLSRAILLPSLLTDSRCMELIANFWKGMASTACSSGQCGVVVVGRRGCDGWRKGGHRWMSAHSTQMASHWQVISSACILCGRRVLSRCARRSSLSKKSS